MKLSNPKVSIIIPCFNPGPFLQDCLKSALNQDYENYEVIFVDNESTDGSVEVAEKFKEAYPELIISQAPNIYKYSWQEPVHEGFSLMSGDYFTIMGADDVIMPKYVSNAMRVRKGRCFQSPIRRVMPNGKYDEAAYKYNNIDEFKQQLLKHCPVNTPSIFYKKDMFEEGLMTWYSDKYLGASDYDLYCQFADKGIMIETIDSWLGYIYRVHERQSTWGMVNEARSGNNFDSKIKLYWSEKWNLG